MTDLLRRKDSSQRLAFSTSSAVAALVGLTLALIVACGPGSRSRGTTPALLEGMPREITEANLRDSLRLYEHLPPDEPARAALRGLILDHYASQSTALIERDDFDAVVEHFANMTMLLTPEDFGSGTIPEQLQPVARYLVDKGSPRGDEARVMSALRVLAALSESPDVERGEYQRVLEWGRDARATQPNPLRRYSALIRVWDEHARLTPAPEVLHTLAQLHVDRRDGVIEAFREGPALLMQMGAGPAQVMRVAPLDVAAVYLRHGDLASAITHVRAMGPPGENEGRLIRALEEARGDSSSASDALVELSEAYREARPGVSIGVCRLGLQRFTQDARFPTCLARVAGAKGDFAGATAWYTEAIELAPEVRPLYDEALERIDLFLERGLAEHDPVAARDLARRAERILAERTTRWPSAESPVPRGRIELLVGTAEMQAGNADEARRRFEASIEDHETTDALLQLGLLRERTGQPADAARLYRRALDLTPNDDFGDKQRRARILEHLGDAFRSSEDNDQAARMYQQALDVWAPLVGELESMATGEPTLEAERRVYLARMHTRRGVLYDRLGQRDESREAFRAAMMAAPQLRETYAAILSHLVAAKDPDLELANEVFRSSQRQITLEPLWKVYFALWVSTVAARDGARPDSDVMAVLQAHVDTQGWGGKLARFSLGDLPYDELLREADGIGEETEAHFYEGARLMASGDNAGARRLFERVLGTQMVNFYEFSMAQELLGN